MFFGSLEAGTNNFYTLLANCPPKASNPKPI